MDVKNLKMKYSQYDSYLEDILFYLKAKQTTAVADKRPDDATLLTEQIWTLKDYKAGHLRGLSQERLAEVFEIFEKFIKKPAPSIKEENQKKLKSLRKKRDQIKKLVERQSAGENLETNQIEKIKTLSDIEDEIAELE